jgi:DNA-directed RNA polymerase specialized sigma24 family protein
MRQSFEEIVGQHGGTVLRACRVIIGIHDAEDAWSETFLAAMRAYPDLPGEARAETWLVSIAHRTATSVLRARVHRPAPTVEVGEVSAVTGALGEESGDLWRAVAALPEKQRQATAYHYIAGLARPEAAGIPGGTPDSARGAAADGARKLPTSDPGTAT